MKKTYYIVIMIVLSITSLIATNSGNNVSAASCDTEFNGGGAAPSLYLQANTGTVENTVDKMTAEFTPSQTWGTGSHISTSYRFAKSDCTSANSDIFIRINGSAIEVQFYDGTRSGSFVSGTDYKNVASGVVVNSSSNVYNATATYTASTMTSGQAQQLSIDIGAEAGWAGVYIKQGSGSNTRLVSFKLPSGATAFRSTNSITNGISYFKESFSDVSCSNITGSGEVLVRALADDVALALSLTTGETQCSNFDKSTYNTSSKTASLKYDTTNEVPRHIVKSSEGNAYIKLKSNSQSLLYLLNSLATDEFEGNHYMSDSFTSSNESNKKVYLYTSLHDENDDSVQIPYPVVAGNFDFSSQDVTLDDTVQFDYSSSLYASMAHNLASKTVSGSFDLFAQQREGDEFVGVCPGADDINAVNTTCGDLYFLKNGETKNGVTASVVTVGAKNFWQVQGLTGTGVFSSTIGVIPGVSNTGLNKKTTQIIVLAFAVIATSLLVQKRYAQTKMFKKRR